MNLITLKQTPRQPASQVTTTKMLTPQEIADILGISYEAALAFIKNSGIDYIRVGRQYRVSEDKFRAFLSQGGCITVDLT